MPGIVIPQSFNNPALPVGESLADALIADPAISYWFQADANHVELDASGITAFIDRKGSGTRFTRNGSANSPELTPDQFEGYAGAVFNSADPDYCFLSSPPDLTQPFTWAGIARLDDNSASSNLMGKFSNSSTRCILNVSANNPRLNFLYGSSQSIGVAIPVGAAFGFIASFDGTKIAISVGGVTATATAAGAPSTTALSLGALPGGSQFWAGAVSDIIICNGIGALDGSADGAAVLAKIRGYFETVYGVSA